jgi:hypothetical protein
VLLRLRQEIQKMPRGGDMIVRTARLSGRAHDRHVLKSAADGSRY